jgi:hypothetical protein
MSAMMTLSSAAAQIPFFQIPTAQQRESSSSVVGIVLDASGAIIPDAVIEVIRNGSAQKLQAKTDENGKFLVKALTPGVYAIRVESPGFRTYNKQILIGRRQDYKLTATLDIGEVTMGGPVAAIEEVLPKQPSLEIPYTPPKVPPLVFPPAK